MLYKVYNTIMHIVHVIIILTSVFGFLAINFIAYYLILQILILCSWIGYGFYDKRWGRCIITEIHWHLKEAYEQRPKTESYIQYWIKYKLGIDANESTVDKYTTSIYALTFLAGIAKLIIIRY